MLAFSPRFAPPLSSLGKCPHFGPAAWPPPALPSSLAKMGLRRDIDLACTCRCATRTKPASPRWPARAMATVQIEATVTAARCSCARAACWCRWMTARAAASCAFQLLPSHQKTLAVGARLRIRGEVKGGFWGRQMLHPAFRLAGASCPPLTRLPHHRPSLSAPRWSAPWGGWICRTPCRRGSLPMPFMVKMASSAVYCARRSLLHHPTPDVACPRWKTTATRPGSA
jgi:ATP-dependent DNA helicase RecG